MRPANPALRKYYLGLGLIAVFTVIIALVVAGMGLSGRQDKQTYAKAVAISDKLNSYVSRQQKIPASLEDAGISDVPETISYTKKSSESYEFCVTYKQASTDFAVTDVESAVSGAALRDLTNSSDSSSRSNFDLFLTSSHKKGRNCQTVTPYIYSSKDYCLDFCDYSGNSKSSSPTIYNN